jgi:hypothetical protein
MHAATSSVSTASDWAELHKNVCESMGLERGISQRIVESLGVLAPLLAALASTVAPDLFK